MIGVLALLVGVVLYLVDRPPENVYFFPEALGAYTSDVRLFGAAGLILPTFVHMFAFALLTAGILSCKNGHAVLACSGWLITDVLFEIGQHEAISHTLSRTFPAWFEGVPILENVESYFVRGTFDPLDVLSILLGAGTAYLVILMTTERRKTHGNQNSDC